MRVKLLFRCFAMSLFLFGAIGCEYTDYPDPIWDPDATGEVAPVITSIDPAEVAYEGLTVVTITGENFSPVTTENQVTFNGRVAQIDASQSSITKLVVTTPIIISDASLNALDAVQVMVAVQGAYAGAIYDANFRVERAVIEWGGFIGEQPEKLPNAVAVDADENVYVAAVDKIIYKIDTDNVRTAFGSGLSVLTYDLKVGPEGYLYYARNIGRIYRVPPEGGAGGSWHSVGSKITCFDFNADQNLYCAGKNDSIYFVNVATEIDRGVALSQDYIYNALKVYDGYVYVSGIYDGVDPLVTTTQAIWRHEILAGDDLGPRELVYDWADYSFSVEQDIQSIVVDSEGLFYIGVSEGSGPAIITLNITTLVVEPFYEAVLTTPTTKLAWGNSNYIYCVRNRATSTTEVPTGLFRISQSSTSAPYYGRN